ncbi:MAG TPA: response regulator transcription factor [Armatimonadota bacterium]|jgi:DNA-binding response OmpR family regulator
MVLLIEDDEQIRELLPRYFSREGMTMLTAPDGQRGLQAIREHAPALVVLDVNLPDMDGWSILRRLRETDGYQPAVIMLTGRGDVPDRLLGLNLGADDYIIKPFEPLEVVARTKAVLRRAGGMATGEDALRFPGLCIDVAGRTVRRHEQDVALAPKEFDLLVTLARSVGRVLSRLTLLDLVWGDDAQCDDHTLEVHVNRLRSKLAGDDGKSYLTTVRGVGYKFEVADA